MIGPLIAERHTYMKWYVSIKDDIQSLDHIAQGQVVSEVVEQDMAHKLLMVE